MWLQTHLLARRGVYNIFFLNEFFASMFSEESEEPGEKKKKTSNLASLEK